MWDGGEIVKLPDLRLLNVDFTYQTLRLNLG
jgi:hypothetical protein